jgi:dTDP-4-dehydrorhamnose 3,5-epimerase
VAVAQRIPLALTHDRGERVELQQQDPAPAEAGGSLCDRRRLVGGVHHAEAVEDHVGRPVVDDNEPTIGEQPQPRTAVGAAVLDHGGPDRQPPGTGHPADRVGRLLDERGRLGPPGLLGRSGIGQQLRQATAGAEPHLQWVDGVGPGVAGRREVVGRGLVAQVEDDLARRRPARPTPVGRRRQFSLCHGSRSGWHDDVVHVRTTSLAGVLVFEPTPHRDERGLFTRTFDAEVAAAHDIDGAAFVQDSQSRSARGVLRGMHGRGGVGEAKLVRCAHGAVHDVLVDARPGSPTFGAHEAFVLDDDAFHHLYVPPGMLHGFQALTDVADVCYRIDRPHDPTEDVAVRHDDPDLAIAWPLPVTVISDRDAGAGTWAALLAEMGAPGTRRPR